MEPPFLLFAHGGGSVFFLDFRPRSKPANVIPFDCEEKYNVCAMFLYALTSESLSLFGGGESEDAVFGDGESGS